MDDYGQWTDGGLLGIGKAQLTVSAAELKVSFPYPVFPGDHLATILLGQTAATCDARNRT